MQSQDEKIRVMSQVMLDVQSELSEAIVAMAIKQVKGIVPPEYTDAAATGLMALALGLLHGRSIVDKKQIDSETLAHVLVCDNCLHNLAAGIVDFIPINGATLSQTVSILAAQGVRNGLRPPKAKSVDIKIPGVKP